VVDVGALEVAVRRVQAVVDVDRLEATIEAHIEAAAEVRERCGIPGTSVRTAYLCRDKPAMKEVLRQVGVPTAQSTGVDSAEDLFAFARAVGYPLIIKPRAAAGASGTVKVHSDDELTAAIPELGFQWGQSVAVEEYIEGHEAFYDTISINGRPALEFISHYYPNVLEAMRTRWISPVFITTNRIDSPGYEEVKELGKQVIPALGIGTSATHMEWFFGPKGLKFSEIACRPPGVGAWDLYCAANDLDVYQEWALAICHGTISRPASRRFSAGIIALRPDQDGTITGYEGIGEIQQRYGRFIIDYHLPPPGTPTQPVEAGYMANAWIRMKHEDYDELRDILDHVGMIAQLRAS
jgi:phosphoribosylaminoimidazole carboxylase (NCAIR synthetase)